MNDNTPLKQEAKLLLSEILTLAWPSTCPNAAAYQLAYLKGMVAEMAAHDRHLLAKLETHRDIVADNNREMF